MQINEADENIKDEAGDKCKPTGQLSKFLNLIKKHKAVINIASVFISFVVAAYAFFKIPFQNKVFSVAFYAFSLLFIFLIYCILKKKGWYIQFAVSLLFISIYFLFSFNYTFNALNDIKKAKRKIDSCNVALTCSLTSKRAQYCDLLKKYEEDCVNPEDQAFQDSFLLIVDSLRAYKTYSNMKPLFHDCLGIIICEFTNYPVENERRANDNLLLQLSNTYKDTSFHYSPTIFLSSDYIKGDSTYEITSATALAHKMNAEMVIWGDYTENARSLSNPFESKGNILCNILITQNLLFRDNPYRINKTDIRWSNYLIQTSLKDLYNICSFLDNIIRVKEYLRNNKFSNANHAFYKMLKDKNISSNSNFKKAVMIQIARNYIYIYDLLPDSKKLEKKQALDDAKNVLSEYYVEFKGKDAAYYCCNGYLKIKENDIPEAIASYDSAITLTPFQYENYTILAEIYAEQGRKTNDRTKYTNAINTLQKYKILIHDKDMLYKEDLIDYISGLIEYYKGLRDEVER